MARVSKRRLPEKELQGLSQQLSGVIGRLNSRQVEHFLKEFLGPEEKEVLAKRLAVVIMLHEGHSRYATAELLRMSQTTVGTIAERYKRGTYNATLTMLRKNKKDYLAFLDTLDSILHLGGILPHYASGRERWKHLKL